MSDVLKKNVCQEYLETALKVFTLNHVSSSDLCFGMHRSFNRPLIGVCLYLIPFLLDFEQIPLFRNSEHVVFLAKCRFGENVKGIYGQYF